MRISNMGLMVKDLEGARKFFEDYFGAVLHAEYSEDNGYKSYIMKFDENPKIELMTKPEIVDVVKTRNDAGFIHICIKVDSKEQFETILEKIRSAGYEILYEPATVGGQE
ncbi:MAG: VOC family protein, partial [Erysipelotrichaceae bacterium]|nr:VOC family protein [Erysipelotrichaceae bacterium]